MRNTNRRLGKFSLDIPVLLKSRTTGKTGPIKTCGDRRRAKQIETEFGEDACCRVEGKGGKKETTSFLSVTFSNDKYTTLAKCTLDWNKLEQRVLKVRLTSIHFYVLNLLSASGVHAAHVGSCVAERIHTVATGCGGEPRDGGGAGM